MMRPGQYYIGDLCYVMEDRWDEVCNLIIEGNICKNGIFQLADGTKFAIYNTKHGDGVYSDQYGRKYAVDSGSIGCILMDDIKVSINTNLIGFYHTYDAQNIFDSFENDGTIEIGEISIDTDPANYDA